MLRGGVPKIGGDHGSTASTQVRRNYMKLLYHIRPYISVLNMYLLTGAKLLNVGWLVAGMMKLIVRQWIMPHLFRALRAQVPSMYPLVMST